MGTVALLAPVPSTGQLVSPLLPALCPLGGRSATPGCPASPRCEAALARGRCLSPEGCELLSWGCWFSPSPLRLVFSASPRCRWPRARELSALLTRARKSALPASGHCVRSWNCRRRSRGLSLPWGGNRVAVSPPLPPKSCAAHGHGRVLSAPGCPGAPRGSDGHGWRLGSAGLWVWCGRCPCCAQCPQGLPRCHQRGPRRGGLLWVCLEGMGLGVGCGGAALQAAPGLAGEDQGRNEQETLIFFIVALFLAWKGPVAFYKTTSPNLPGLGLAHREPQGRRRCWWLGGLQTA